MALISLQVSFAGREQAVLVPAAAALVEVLPQLAADIGGVVGPGGVHVTCDGIPVDPDTPAGELPGSSVSVTPAPAVQADVPLADVVELVRRCHDDGWLPAC